MSKVIPMEFETTVPTTTAPVTIPYPSQDHHIAKVLTRATSEPELLLGMTAEEIVDDLEKLLGAPVRAPEPGDGVFDQDIVEDFERHAGPPLPVGLNKFCDNLPEFKEFLKS